MLKTFFHLNLNFILKQEVFQLPASFIATVCSTVLFLSKQSGGDENPFKIVHSPKKKRQRKNYRAHILLFFL
ncbi:hypothetical protein A7K93_06590 [Candidatus Methylacidiphilum fumarolicum]|nr:hypothetical protein A7K93_06590 [Candidatus Methylacidiphilum fumarolicum]TFE73266.1 hypothetical protein A7K72_07015 [Candidatus Methylacidiphilum fumarolicum]